MRDFNTRAAFVKGRIDLWLESVEVTDNSEELANRVAQAKQAVSRIENNLAPEDFKERFNSILNRVGNSMSRWAEKLNLEHSENPIRFDPKRLSPVIDREDRAVPLARIGSGANWVGFHLITLFAFHKHFVNTNRPVPRFLFLDQPSQVYYPSEKDDDESGSLENIPVDDDRKALRRMYDTIFEFVAEMDSGMQIIILDHASIPTDEFQSAIVEEWRGDDALIPKSWITVTL